MLERSNIIAEILEGRKMTPFLEKAEAFAPANLALVKYWGKRNLALNLPITSSLSISMGKKGTKIALTPIEKASKLELWINGKIISPKTKIYTRFEDYLHDFPFWRKMGLCVRSQSNIPIGAGLASSSSAFAALVSALNQFFAWELSLKQSSILARMGSGSAARSFWQGFVLWHRGEEMRGMDSFAEPIEAIWPELRLGLMLVERSEKPIGSTAAMNRTVETSSLYRAWPSRVAIDIKTLQNAIEKKKFKSFGEIAEGNADFMHRTMHDATPPINYHLPQTLELSKKVRKLRKEGLDLYYTQDAGPNLKLLFLEKDQAIIQKYFDGLEIISPFDIS